MFLFRVAAGVAAVFNRKARALVEGRKGIFDQLQQKLSAQSGQVIWMHCASLGEFEQGRPVLEILKKDFPDCRIVLTFFSPSGYEVRKNYAGADHICYLPWDTAKNAERFISVVKPVLAIFVKYEFWFHYFDFLQASNVPILSISAIFRKDQLFFKSYGGFYRSILAKVSHFFVQNESSMKLLRSIGIEQCSMAGDTRFDRVFQIVNNAEELPVASEFKGQQKLFVIGSCWPADLQQLAPFINEHNIKFIIAPHEISESFITAIERALPNKTVRYSSADKIDAAAYQVLIIDNVGMLSRLYRYGEFAYVGGAFGKGLHNILEAACYGRPVFFGNQNFQKFQEAVDLISLGGAFAIGSTFDLTSTYQTLLSNERYTQASHAAASYVKQNLGATEKIVSYCRPLLKS
ncbi:MAG: glycosyltransferase N-terminal domain-containing protein [Chryseolinea sp.]